MQRADMSDKTKRIVWAGLFAALTAAATFVVIPIPSMTNGYVNAGDALVILGSFLLGPGLGAIAAAIGSTLTDILYGYFVYAPATFIIKGLMALTAGFILLRLGKKQKLFPAILAAITAELIMVAGYLGYETLIYGFAGAVVALIGNLIQAAFGAVASVVLYSALIRIPFVRQNFTPQLRSKK